MSKSKTELQEFVDDLRANGNMPEELVEIFAEEADDHLNTITDGLDRLRVDHNDMEAIGDIRRSAHTLKGAAGAVGSPAVSNLAYRLETFLNLLLERERGANEIQVALCLDAGDLLADILVMEMDFDELAVRLQEISIALDKQIEIVTAGESTESTHSPATENVEAIAAASPTNDKDLETIEPVVVAEVSDKEVQEIRGQLTNGMTLPEELVEIFAEEAEDHLRSMYAGLQKMNSDRTDVESLGQVRRSTHTLKGAAAAVGLEVITRLTHRMEDLLDYLAESQTHPTESQVDLFLRTTDQVQTLQSDNIDVEESVGIITELYGTYGVELAKSQDSQAIQAGTTTVQTTDAPVVQSTALTTTSDIEIGDQSSAPVEKTPVEKTAADKTKPKKDQQYLRVPIDRLDGLVALIGEMIVNRSAFNQRLSDFEDRIGDMNTSLQRFRSVAQEVETRYSVDALKSGRRTHLFDHKNQKLRFDGMESRKSDFDELEFDRYTEFHLTARTLSEATNDVAVVTSELKNLHGDFHTLLGRQQRHNRDAQDTLLQIRMVPVSSIANRLERTVRTVSNKIGKKVDLKVVGGNTELDKTVLEEIVDPLLHLVRNGLDHGIETPEERLKAGKSDRAHLTLQALNQGTRVTLRIIDDGHGIDLDKIRLKAIERGMISEGQVLNKQELLELIFLPGFSTADSLTDVSGRGVGMDVVREAVKRLKGTINVESEIGQGSTFTIHLPTTLAATRALIVESNGLQFAIPMQAIQQITRLEPDSVSHVGEQSLIRTAGGTLQLRHLSVHMGMADADDNHFETTRPMLLIRAGDDESAVTVDSIEGGQDIVVKTLGDHLRTVPGYIGATVSGDGTVIPILDPADLCGQETTSAMSSSFQRLESMAANRRKLAMVIDDSLSVRRVTTNLLRLHGWDVLDAKDGVDALEQLANAETPPDVFLCDMEMPRMDGLEFVRRIRSQSEFTSTPVVMVTSRAAEKHRKLAAEAGADEHVVKPFNDDRLMELITRMVAESRELVGA